MQTKKKKESGIWSKEKNFRPMPEKKQWQDKHLETKQ